MSDLVERVARAICEADPEGRLFDVCRADFEAMARAAIAAMRNPTDAMRRAADPTLPHPSLEALRVWRTMIEAAITD